jgi:hypothetical protein
MSMEVVIDQLVSVLGEAFEGPGQSWSYFADHGKESGLFGTLEKLSAADASRVAGGSTIAAHAHHILFSLVAAAAWIRGDHGSRNWQESWSVTSVDDAQWQGLRDELRKQYSDLRRAFKSRAASSVEAMGGAIGAIAHAAYHLGAVRQKAKWIQQAGPKMPWTRDELHERQPKE